MTDPALAAPAPATRPRAVEPWQARLEALGLLLTIGAAVFLGARVANSYELQRPGGSDGFASVVGSSVDWVQVLRFAGQGVGVLVAGAIVVSFLLVTLGPGDELSRRGVLTLRLDVLVGLIGAGLSGFAAVSVLVQDQAGPFVNDATVGAGGRDVLARASAAAPLVVAAAIAVYVAWCAFSTLGELRREPTAGLAPDEAPAHVATPEQPDAPGAGWGTAPTTYPSGGDGSEWAPPTEPPPG